MIKKIDHVVITVADLGVTKSFYEKLGFKAVDGGGRLELYAGDFKINVHLLGKELLPHALNVRVGSADLCFEIDNLNKMIELLEQNQVPLLLKDVPRTGVKGKMQSVYLRDPDGNLLEFSEYGE